MRRSIDETLRDLPQVMDRAGIAPDLDALTDRLHRAPQRGGGRWWLLGSVATLAALVAVAALVRHGEGPVRLPAPAATKKASLVRNYGQARQELGQRLARAPIPAYLPLTVGKGLVPGSIDASYRVTQLGYSVTMGYGPKTPLPLNSPKAQFGNAELLMIVRGAAPGGSLQLSQWIPLPSAVPIPNAAQGTVDLGHGIVATNFVGGAGPSTVEAVTWREGGWTFWVGPWVTANWGNPEKAAAQEAAMYLHTKFPGKDGVAVFAAGQDDPSEAVFSVGRNRYAVLALGWRAAQFAATMAPTR